MIYIPPWQRPCDCRCPLHYQRLRTAYDEAGCACTITCASQPLTLLADRWNCALFLHPNGELWHVPAIFHGNWDWEAASKIDTRADFYEASVGIEHLLRLATQLLAIPFL